MNLPAETVFRTRPDIRHRQVGNEGVVVLQDSAEVLVVNGLGARVLDLTDGGLSLQEMLGHLTDEFDVEPARLHADLSRYLSELLAAGVVETLPES